MIRLFIVDHPSANWCVELCHPVLGIANMTLTTLSNMESADAELLDDNEAVAIPDKTKDEKKRKMVLNKRKTKYVKMT